MSAESGSTRAIDRMPLPFVSGIVLAAGASTRMGQTKQLLLLDGRPLLQHVLEQAVASSLAEVVLRAFMLV